MIRLFFINQTDAPFNETLFLPLLRGTAHRVSGITEDEVEFSLVDDRTMQRINKETRGIDKPTDVLSFAMREIEGYRNTLPPEVPVSLGQIVISVPAAERNAHEMHQSLEEELRFLFVHGLLHILGYDHQATADETEMMTLAYQILGRPSYQP